MIGLETTHNELAEWFLRNYPEIVKVMDESEHFYSATDLNPYHYENRVLAHTWMVFKLSQIFCPENQIVKWSTLLHDIGKPAVRTPKDDTRRVAFHGHEGMSAFMAADILNNTSIPEKEKIDIFRLIAVHGDLFRFVDAGGVNAKIYEYYRGEKDLFRNLVYQVYADSNGRICADGPEKHVNLPELFAEAIVKMPPLVETDYNDKVPRLTVLVGPPCCGKSTWLKANYNGETIISRDDLVVEAGERRGLNYTETMKFMRKNRTIEKAEVDGQLIQNVAEARKNKESVIVDMTNMSKKVRRRWINEFAKYRKKAVVFMVGMDELRRRNKIRNDETGKFIPEFVLHGMCSRYSLPLYNEKFDELEHIWN